MARLPQDFSHGLRALRRNPGFTVVSILTLALGIGSTSALFSVLDAALLHPLSAPQPERLLWLQEFSADRSESGGNPSRLADWQSAHSLAASAGFYSEGVVWASADGPLQLEVLRTFGDLGAVLGAKLQLGRSFTPSELRGEGQPVALLTSNTFRRRFNANPAVLSQSLRLAGTAYQVIGVLRPDVDFPEDADVWTPSYLNVPSRSAGFLGTVARLAPGVSLKQAQTEIDLIAARLAKQYPSTDAGRSARLSPLVERISETVRKPLLVLFAAVAGVFLIGCLNISGLLLARGLARRREAAIRVSLGAGRARLMRLFFAESLLLASAGCLAGLLLAVAGVAVLKAALPPDVPHLASVAVNPPVVLAAIALSFLAALVFGALPAWQFASGAQSVSLRDGSAGAGVAKSRLRGLLVLAEIACSVVLLVTAALLANSFLKMRSRPAGFDTAHAYTFTLDFPWDTGPSVLNSASAQTLARFDALPGTLASGVVDRLPLHGGSQSRVLLVRGRTLPPAVAVKEFGFRTATSGFFASAGIPLLSGSLYRDWQAGQGAREAVVSQELARILFPGEDPVGREIAEQPRGGAKPSEPKWFRITGVVGAVALHPSDTEPAAELYVPWGATYWPLMNFVVRSERPLAEVARAIRLPGATLAERTAETRSAARSSALLVVAFAGVALLLSALGIFGLMAYETTRRTREIGIRLALGAEPGGVALEALARAAKLTLAGLLLGLCGAWYASQLLKSLLFGAAPHDAASYLAAAGLLLAAALLASLLPALRAARIDPIQALRHD